MLCGTMHWLASRGSSLLSIPSALHCRSYLFHIPCSLAKCLTLKCHTDGPWICAFHEFAALDNAFILACDTFLAALAVFAMPSCAGPLSCARMN